MPIDSSNMSSSDDERDAMSDEQWDDMAIVRAFEDALIDQRQRAGKAPTRSHKKQAAKTSRKQSRRVSVASSDESDDAASSTAPSPAFGFTAAPAPAPAAPNGPSYQRSDTAPSQANGYAMPQSTAPQSDVYQLAYAQAYAALQTQFQAAAYQAPAPQYPSAYGYSAPHASAYAPQPPMQPQYPLQMPPHAAMPPFPSVPGVPAAPSASDDGLSNLLLAWYQSGYYTGRFQAMQEMKAREHR